MKRYVRLAFALAPALAVLVLTTTLASPARSASPPSPAAIPPLPEPIVFVAADPGNPANWDILYVNTNGATTNLSAQVDVISPAAGNPLFGGATIDNHPALSPDGNQVAFASDRIDGANVDLYVLDIVTSTTVVTVTNVTRLTSGAEPERHPHFSGDGGSIIFDAKRKCGPLKPSQCSQPAVPECDYPGTPGANDGTKYEGMYILNLNTMTESPLLDPRAADPLWPVGSNEGHASLLEDGSRIIFGADRGLGDAGWEVFTADYLPLTQSLANLVQLTDTPGKAMAGGGIFSEDGSAVYFNSTATKNSQLYRISDSKPSSPLQPPDWEQLTDNCANDYVPEHLGGEALLFTRQTYPDPANPDVYDLDVWAKEMADGEVNLTDDAINDQTLLLGDEVVCFCGAPPNTSGCYIPRIWTLCSVRQMRLIVEGRNTLPITIPPDYAQRLGDYWKYLVSWSQRYMIVGTHPELQHRAQYIAWVLQLTSDPWNPALCPVQVVLPGFMPPEPPKVIDTEIVALSLSGQSVPLRVEAEDNYCDGCVDFSFRVNGGSFTPSLLLNQKPTISWTTGVTATWTAPVVTQTRIFSITILVTDTTRLTGSATISVTVRPLRAYLPVIARDAP